MFNLQKACVITHKSSIYARDDIKKIEFFVYEYNNCWIITCFNGDYDDMRIYGNVGMIFNKFTGKYNIFLQAEEKNQNIFNKSKFIYQGNLPND